MQQVGGWLMLMMWQAQANRLILLSMDLGVLPYQAFLLTRSILKILGHIWLSLSIPPRMPVKRIRMPSRKLSVLLALLTQSPPQRLTRLWQPGVDLTCRDHSMRCASPVTYVPQTGSSPGTTTRTAPRLSIPSEAGSRRSADYWRKTHPVTFSRQVCGKGSSPGTSRCATLLRKTTGEY